jgi:hypothetical protein
MIFMLRARRPLRLSRPICHGIGRLDAGAVAFDSRRLRARRGQCRHTVGNAGG